VANFVMDEEIGAEGANGDESLGAEVIEGHEQAEAGDAGDVRREAGPDAILEKQGYIAFQRIPFRRRGAPFGVGNMLADGGEGAPRLLVEPALAEP
jgi:hypothetical protein